MDGSEAVKVDLDYSQIPFYRRRWFVGLSVLCFMPAALVIALTGDVYLKSKGRVYRLPNSPFNHLVLFACVMIIIGTVHAAIG
ncbi:MULTISPECIES: hypothetical protein [Pseudomonas]|uniref:Uncharacterized protein n=1 Tax=Pseudomonas knackmussii TaxID=65741 RepID=A0ABY4KSY2_9PSED|nr:MULTISPECIES: hypothetical protein [Pseudomonas]UPQ83535.1 hypothetical protein M0M42_03780 [Pseudomonas knackmussii]